MAFITPCQPQIWNKTNVTILLIITCGVMIPLHSAEFSDDLKNKTKSHEVSQRLDPLHPTGENQTPTVLSGKPSSYTPNTMASAVNDSSFASLPGPSEPNGGLLTDPLHSNSGSFPVGVPIAKPSVLVTSALLTAAPATATARSNSSIDSDNSKSKQNQGYNNTMAQHPVLSGSMAISLPTPVTPYIPPQATQPPSPASGVATSSSPSPTTVLEVVTAGEVMPTPTTSTTYVYATNSPTSPGSASPPPSSSGHYLSPSFLSTLAGLGMPFKKPFLPTTNLITG
ncbi:hypothetical protein PSHT_00553 [Puccinia striiformis]|uniref:Uncharacterized protein n=1 Tax=Puccinia striiformis TaxID=27350 RepID=A0A2S4WMK4_9BASI|nr:hypothetical protein PSHT_00553 [Puccinia striiformis]